MGHAQHAVREQAPTQPQEERMERQEKMDEAKPKMVSFKFQVLDDTFKDAKTGMKVPLAFSYESIQLELVDGQTYYQKDLPIDLETIHNHLNNCAGYPVYEMQPKVENGKNVGEHSVQTGWEPRFQCINARYA